MAGNIQNREAFLSTIAKRLGREPITAGINRPTWKYNPQDEVLKEATSAELLEVLKTQCLEIHTDLQVTNKANLLQTVKDMVEEYGGGPILAGKDNRFDEFGLSPLLHEVWPNEGVEVHEWDYQRGKENIRLADLANVGLSISDIALAESGTVVLFSRKDQGRSLHFLPSTSIVLVPMSTLVPRITQAAKIMREKVANGEHIPSCINFITGPSNSADIEMDLVVGVHGPVKAAYLVIKDL